MKAKGQQLSLALGLTCSTRSVRDKRKCVGSLISKQCQALGCHIAPLAAASPEYKSMEAYVLQSQVKSKDTDIRVLQIYKVDRGADGHSTVGNNKLLFHGSSVGNIVGLLMRSSVLCHDK